MVNVILQCQTRIFPSLTLTKSLVQPGDSAIFALLLSGEPLFIAQQFRGYDGTILSTMLSPAQLAKVERALA